MFELYIILGVCYLVGTLIAWFFSKDTYGRPSLEEKIRIAKCARLVLLSPVWPVGLFVLLIEVTSVMIKDQSEGKKAFETLREKEAEEIRETVRREIERDRSVSMKSWSEEFETQDTSTKKGWFRRR